MHSATYLKAAPPSSSSLTNIPISPNFDPFPPTILRPSPFVPFIMCILRTLRFCGDDRIRHESIQHLFITMYNDFN